MKQPRPMFRGRELSDDELAMLKAQFEGFDFIEVLDDEMRELIATQWPHLLSRVRPRKDQS